jgi:hypothetical protein
MFLGGVGGAPLNQCMLPAIFTGLMILNELSSEPLSDLRERMWLPDVN